MITLSRTLLATFLMAAAAQATLGAIGPGEGIAVEIARVLVPLLVALAVFFGSYRACGGRELGMLLGGGTRKQP